MFKRSVSLIVQHICHFQLQRTSNSVIRISSKCIPHLQIVRTKYINYGVQGSRENKQKPPASKTVDILMDNDDNFREMVNIESDAEYDSLANGAMHVSRSIQNEQNVLVIQPYIKWGPKKSVVPADIQLQEAEALIRSLDTWAIHQSLTIGLTSFDRQTFFGKGKLIELRDLVRQINSTGAQITCVFVSRSILSFTQKQYLEEVFGVPVMDRFSVVIQILRLHAISRESRLQVAMAEIPYIWKQLGDRGGIRSKLNDAQKLLLRNREKHIKTELEAVRGHRQLLRKRRIQQKFPIIAVVGYTNAGKTALIKALTNEEGIEPKNKLFATLEITAHGGVLPCNLKVIFMDTIGFMADIPTGLIECFIATLEDAMLADLVIHVQDLAHENSVEQRKHVEKTLKMLLENKGEEKERLLNNVITVGNKCDLVEDTEKIKEIMAANERPEPTSQHIISASTMQGINDLRFEIEKNILKTTNQIKMIIRIPMNGMELAWLYKNSAVTRTVADPKNSEYLLAHVVINELTVHKFKTEFIRKKSV